VDQIRPEMLKSLDIVGLSWLTVLRGGRGHYLWSGRVVVLVFEKGDRRVCYNFWGIALVSLPRKVYSSVLERRLRLIEPQLQEEQCGFRPGRGTMDQVFTLAGLFWGHESLPIQSTCALWTWRRLMTVSPRESCGEYCGSMGYRGCWYKPFSPCTTKVSCVRILGTKSSKFSAGVGLHQGCPFSQILFVIFMDRMSRRGRGEESVRFGDLRMASLLFAVIVLVSSDLDLQHALGSLQLSMNQSGRESAPPGLRP